MQSKFTRLAIAPSSIREGLPLEQLYRRQIGSAHEELIDAPCRLAAFGDGPDYEGLAAADVAGGEDAGDVGHVIGVDLDVAAAVFFEVQLVDGAGVLGVDEAEGEEAEVAIHFEFGAGDFLH